MGPGVIIEVPECKINLGITGEFIKQQSIKANDIVFFKTSNSKLPADKIANTFVYLTPEGAYELLQKKVKIVGIDYFSVDDLAEEKLPTHNLLLKNNVLIVENLYLKDIPAGCYSKMAIIPLNIPNMDGLPIRAFACK